MNLQICGRNDLFPNTIFFFCSKLLQLALGLQAFVESFCILPIKNLVPECTSHFILCKLDFFFFFNFCLYHRLFNVRPFLLFDLQVMIPCVFDSRTMPLEKHVVLKISKTIKLHGGAIATCK